MRSRPSLIIILHTVMSLFSAEAKDYAQVERISKIVEASAIPQTFLAIIEKTPSTCTTDHVLINKLSAANVDH